MYVSARVGISRILVVGIVIVLLIIAVGAAVYFTTPTTRTTTPTTRTTATTTRTTATTTRTTATTTSTTATTPHQNISIVYADQGDIITADPCCDASIETLVLYSSVYDTLVRNSNSTPATLVPGLATSWTVSSSDLNYTFHLRQGVLFHDGNEVTANAVAFTMDRMMTINQGLSFMWSGLLAPGDTKVIDKYTVQFNLETPFAPFVSTLTFLFIVDPAIIVQNEASGSYGSNGDYGTGWFAQQTNGPYSSVHDAGAGPYILTQYNHQTFTMERWGKYWQPWYPGAIDIYQYQYTPEEATDKALFAVGDAQITGTWHSTEFYQWGASNGFVLNYPTTPWTDNYLFLNTKVAPFDDVYMRRALNYLMNYSALINQILGGDGVPLDGPLASGSPMYSPPTTHYTYNLTAALHELEQSKYWPEIKTNTLPAITYDWQTDVPWQRDEGLLLSSAAAKLNITINVVGISWGDYISDLGNYTSTPQIAAVGVSPLYNDPDSMLYGVWHSSTYHTWNTAPTFFSNSTVDSLLDQARQSTDPTFRATAYAEIQQIIASQAPAVFCFGGTQPMLLSPYLKNVLYNVEYFWQDPYGWVWTGPATPAISS